MLKTFCESGSWCGFQSSCKKLAQTFEHFLCANEKIQNKNYLYRPRISLCIRNTVINTHSSLQKISSACQTLCIASSYSYTLNIRRAKQYLVWYSYKNSHVLYVVDGGKFKSIVSGLVIYKFVRNY